MATSWVIAVHQFRNAEHLRVGASVFLTADTVFSMSIRSSSVSMLECMVMLRATMSQASISVRVPRCQQPFVVMLQCDGVFA